MNPNPKHFAIPELCTTSAVTLLILFSQLLVVVLLFAGGEVSWVRFGLMSLYVQWVALVSAGLLCALRTYLANLPLGLGVSLMFVVVLSVTAGVGIVAHFVVNPDRDLLGTLTSQLLVSGIITGLVLRYFYVQQRLRIQEQAELNSRIQALQSRIRPHFLFNSMNIIASLIASDPDTAEVVVEDLAELFRASLNEADNRVPLDQELELCKRYIRIEALRLGDRLHMDWQVEDCEEVVQIPLLTLQPLLENAIYHGIQPLPEGGTISVRVTYPGDEVLICIANPVPDPSLTRESEGNRMALANIRSRLGVLYGPNATLETRMEINEGAADESSAVVSDGHRFVTQLRFPRTTDPFG
ncbi:MAG: sensor histidine kinase [Pseudomonadota bacterium]